MAYPNWATIRAETPRLVIDVDAGGMYEAWLEELGVTEPDQYWLEVAYQCGKMDVQAASGVFGKRPIEIRIHDPEKRWAQAQFPPGKGAEAATKGREAREHFRRLRGFLPA